LVIFDVAVVNVIVERVFHVLYGAEDIIQQIDSIAFGGCVT
jgi:hypothetical protein